MNINSVEANKKEAGKGPVKVNNQPKITNVDETTVPALNNKKALAIDFKYKCTYNQEDPQGKKKPKEIGVIKINGQLLFLTNKSSKLVKKWKKDKKLPEEITIPVMNNILRRSVTQALNLSQELQLAPPIKIPMIRKRDTNARYIG